MAVHNVLLAPRTRSLFRFDCDWQSMRFGRIASDTGHTIFLGPFVLDWSYRNINGHAYLCDCTACCIDWAVIDHNRASRLTEK